MKYGTLYSIRGALLCTVMYLLSATLCSAQVYSITDLGRFVEPTSINTWGQVVGTYKGPVFPNDRAVIWTRTDGLRSLGLLPNGTFSRGTAINDFGVVAGTADGFGTVRTGSVETDVNCDNLTQPFVWNKRDGMTGLGTVPFAYGAYADSWCRAPYFGVANNNSGQVVGYNGIPGSSYQQGFLWSTATGMEFVIGDWPGSYANDISNTGQVVGQQGEFGIDRVAVSWKDGLITHLEVFNTERAAPSSANGVNDLGQIVGFSSLPASFAIHAVFWTRSLQILDLGTLPGDTLSVATKINFFGQVIGSSGNYVTGQGNGEAGGSVAVMGRPFVWSQRKGMRDLKSLVRAKGWVLEAATDINIWGQIVGIGTLNGEPHGYLLTPKILFDF